jgi:Spy/CpxP family protein refolding chaperone
MKGRPTLWLVAALVLVFLAGAVSGVFLGRSVLSRRSGEARRPSGHYPSLEMMARELNLTADQQARIKEIFARNEVRFRELRGDIRQHLDDIRKQLKTEIDSVLTPEQIKKFQAMIERHRTSARREYNRHHPDSQDRPPVDHQEGEKQ